jgi:hypothetical protein
MVKIVASVGSHSNDYAAGFANCVGFAKACADAGMTPGQWCVPAWTRPFNPTVEFMRGLQDGAESRGCYLFVDDAA